MSELSYHFDKASVVLDGSSKGPLVHHSPPPIEINVRDLCLDVKRRGLFQKGQVRLLTNIDATFRAGELIALMGCSGAGKSTLLNVLSGRVDGTVSGSVLVNGLEPTEDFYRRTCYVMQDDVMWPLLTVREQVDYSARFRLPRGTKEDEIEARVQHMVERLQIAMCARTRVGGGLFPKGVSGGERKRCALAAEMITGPSVLFLDEPTSGLDSTTAASLVHTLREMSREGHAIIATIHQPSTEVFHLFDKLLLLAKPGDGTGGQVAYFGPVADAELFFASAGFPCPPKTNPADHYLKVITPLVSQASIDEEAVVVNQQDIHQVLQHFNQHLRPQVQRVVDERMTKSYDEYGRRFSNPADAVVPLSSSQLERLSASAKELRESHGKGRKFHEPPPEQISVLHQTGLLLKQHSLMMRRNPRAVAQRILSTIFLSLLGGFVYLLLPFDQTGVQNRQGSLFFFVTNTCIATVLMNLGTYTDSRLIFLREHAAHSYRSFPYWFAKSTLAVPLDVVAGLIYCSLAYFMCGYQRIGTKFGIFLAAILMNIEASASISLFLSSGARTQQGALMVAPAILLPMILFGGFFVAPGTIPDWLGWFKWLSPLYYTFPILINNEMTGLDFYCTPSQLVIPGGPACANLTLLNATNATLPCLALCQGVCPFTSGTGYLTYAGFANVNYIFNFGLLGVITFGFRMLGYIVFWLAKRNVHVA